MTRHRFAPVLFLLVSATAASAAAPRQAPDPLWTRIYAPDPASPIPEEPVMTRAFAPLLLAAGLGASAASAQELLVCESNFETVLLVSGVDGSVIDPVYLSLNTSTGTPPKFPIQATAVGSEVWVTDQVADVIFRYDRQGNYLGEVGGPHGDLNGIATFGGEAWVTNSTGTAGKSLKHYDLDGNPLAVIDVSSWTNPAALAALNGEIVVADVDGDDLDRYDLDGNYLGQLHDSDGTTGVNTPQQLVWSAGTGTLLVAGYDAPSGIYEYLPNGVQVNFIDTAALGFPGVRGVHPLTNGNILFTTATGLHVYDRAGQSVTTEFGGVLAWYISKLPPEQLGFVYCDETQNPNNVANITIDTLDSNAASITVTLSNGVTGQFCNLLVGDGNGTVSQPPGSKGDLCIVGGACMGRFTKDLGQIQNGMFQVDIVNAISSPPCGGFFAVTPGSTWNFQYWHRQPMGQPSSFSAALSVTFE